ncbi:MAG: hypothetical protein AAGA62_13405, partial [Bacteroidota bacterium]
MNLFLLAVLLFCLFGVLHTYLFYPQWILKKARTQVLAKLAEREQGQLVKEDLPPWPEVFVLMAVHNEESVLPAKLDSLG